jgi:hypothetical protein
MVLGGSLFGGRDYTMTWDDVGSEMVRGSPTSPGETFSYLWGLEASSRELSDPYIARKPRTPEAKTVVQNLTAPDILGFKVTRGRAGQYMAVDLIQNS